MQPPQGPSDFGRIRVQASQTVENGLQNIADVPGVLEDRVRIGHSGPFERRVQADGCAEEICKHALAL